MQAVRMHGIWVTNWQKYILLGLKLITITFIKQLLNDYRALINDVALYRAV